MNMTIMSEYDNFYGAVTQHMPLQRVPWQNPCHVSEIWFFWTWTSPLWMQIVRMLECCFLDARIKSLSRGNRVLNVKNVRKTFSEGYATHRCKEGKVKQMHL